jgi:hypothetical protein
MTGIRDNLLSEAICTRSGWPIGTVKAVEVLSRSYQPGFENLEISIRVYMVAGHFISGNDPGMSYGTHTGC